jgi:Cu+-exporting ATPase
MAHGSCSGSCGGQCGGESPALTAPANAAWTTLHVTGMHCGGCARRIERAVASVQGVLGVKADFHGAKVEIATAAGTDARRLVQPTIDGLGYHVE